MREESTLTKEELLEQLQAEHQARLDNTAQKGQTGDYRTVQYQDLASNAPEKKITPPQPNVPESYLNYAAQLLEQMRSVYGSSWNNCSCGSHWHGGYQHFYDPCSGADVPPPSCPPPDCNSNLCCKDNTFPNKPVYPPPTPDCGCGTVTYYDDCAYKLQQLSDQMKRVETMTEEMYTLNQQLYRFVVEYLQKLLQTGTGDTKPSGSC